MRRGRLIGGIIGLFLGVFFAELIMMPFRVSKICKDLDAIKKILEKK